MQHYLDDLQASFTRYKTLAEDTLAQVDDAALYWQYNAESNSMAIIIQHLAGNMLSRWTDFLTTDGEKPERQRDAEFIHQHSDRAALLQQWQQAWQVVFATLQSLTVADLQRTVYIRGEAHTVVAALNRQLAHCAYHVGQLVMLGKMQCSGEWRSLSIPKGGSAAYNQQAFRKNAAGDEPAGK